jgi:ankyrin repeat protein
MGSSPLHKACSLGRNEVVSLLLSRGANIHVTKKVNDFDYLDSAACQLPLLTPFPQNGFTPLHEACAAGQRETVELLLHFGATVLLFSNFYFIFLIV